MITHCLTNVTNFLQFFVKLKGVQRENNLVLKRGSSEWYKKSRSALLVLLFVSRLYGLCWTMSRRAVPVPAVDSEKNISGWSIFLV